MTFDPLTAPLGPWAWGVVTQNLERVCCGAPSMAHHYADCPNTPIFADMAGITRSPLEPRFWPWPLIPIDWPEGWGQWR